MSLLLSAEGAKSYSAGLRVVCGPSWNVDKTDGKEGFVGTVVELARDSSSVPENMALVQWDTGLCQPCIEQAMMALLIYVCWIVLLWVRP